MKGSSLGNPSAAQFVFRRAGRANRHGGYDVPNGVMLDYQTDPSAVCLDVWKRYGPYGTFVRQLVE
jgi:hypothetical protein